LKWSEALFIVNIESKQFILYQRKIYCNILHLKEFFVNGFCGLCLAGLFAIFFVESKPLDITTGKVVVFCIICIVIQLSA